MMRHQDINCAKNLRASVLIKTPSYIVFENSARRWEVFSISNTLEEIFLAKNLVKVQIRVSLGVLSLPF